MKTNRVIAAVLAGAAALSAGEVKVLSATRTSALIEVTAEAPVIKAVVHNGITYHRVGVPGFSNVNREGLPALPAAFIQLITAENPAFTVTVQSIDADTIRNILVEPALLPPPAVVGRVAVQKFVVAEMYAKDAVYPAASAEVGGIGMHSGIALSSIRMCPISCNPVKKEIIVARRMVLELNFAAAPAIAASNLRPQVLTVLRSAANSAACFSMLARSAPAPVVNDDADDLIIITTNTFAEAAETLAVWQRMKGFGVKIESRASWTSAEAKTVIQNFYTATNPKPGYLLIIGDIDDVPESKYLTVAEADGGEAFPTDLYYVCFDGGSDYVPEMARGRISADNADEALRIVRKIIRYEQKPPASASFYANAVASGFFQDYGEDGQMGFEDRRFIETVEDIKQYLTPLGINSQRQYKADLNAATPTNYNGGWWSDGSALPAELRSPFPWNGSAAGINAAINNGIFLLYHYDHGYEEGWGDPAWSNSDLSSLNNGENLPIIFSIDCLVGKWDYSSYNVDDCFAEEALALDNAGAVGIVAASTVSYSGPNEAIMMGMVDAIWPSPGLVLNSPVAVNTSFPAHDPITLMGDVVNQGLARMEANVGSSYSAYHYQMYHWFGDPSMCIWKGVPTTLAPTHVDIVGINTGSFTVADLGAMEGVATLYNSATAKIVGAATVAGGSVSIPLDTGIGNGDNLILTISGGNVRPYIATVPAGLVNPVAGTGVAGASYSIGALKQGSITLSLPTAGLYHLSITGLNGRSMLNRDLRLSAGVQSCALGSGTLAQGMAIVKLSGPAGNLVQKELIR